MRKEMQSPNVDYLAVQVSDVSLLSHLHLLLETSSIHWFADSKHFLVMSTSVVVGGVLVLDYGWGSD